MADRVWDSPVGQEYQGRRSWVALISVQNFFVTPNTNMRPSVKPLA